jgi:outer membrane protein assembly factor BamA
VLGDRLLSTGAQISGTLEDLGGWLTYLNRRHRWNWGLSAEQSPYRAEFVQALSDPAANTFVATTSIDRQLSRGVFGLAEYPFNQSKRVEFAMGARHLSFSRQQRTSTFDLASGELIQRTQERVPVGRPLNLAEASMAFVHDTSYFGAVSPIFGRRYRIEAAHSRGTLSYNTLLVDARQYAMPVRPVTIGIRAMTYGRYGRDAGDELLVPLFLGYPEMLHGYGFGSFTSTECPDARTADGAARLCAPLDNLIGTRVAVANLEIRAPIPGLFRGELEYGRVPLEIVGFFDAGVAWSEGTRPEFAGGTRPVSRSIGAAIRVNVFGLFAAELSAARPLDRVTRSLRWQLGIRQGF